MKKEVILTYQEKKHTAVFNTNTARSYAAERGLKTLNEFQKDLASDDFVKGKEPDISFETLEKYRLYLFCALSEGARIQGKDLVITLDDVFPLMEENGGYVEIMKQASKGEEVDPKKPRAKAKNQSRKK